MQIVIDIPEEIKAVIDKNGTNEIVAETVWQAVKNGTPLPKHHGRLIDADRLKSMYSINRAYLYFNTVVGIQKWVDDAPTILEATEEVQE